MRLPLSLIVDDLPAVREYLRVVLQLEGFEVVEASNGLEALQVVQRLGDAIDIVISDVQMPLMNGVALAAAIRAEHPRMPVLLITGCPIGRDCDRPVLHKPFGRDVLRSAVSSAMTPFTAAATTPEPVAMLA